MKATAHRAARTAFTHRIDVRQHQLTADEPNEHGGDDEGPSPQELLAASASRWATPPPPERASTGQSTILIPASRSSARARSPSPGVASTARVAPPWRTTSKPARLASRAVARTQ